MRDKRSKLQIYFDVFSAILIEKQDNEEISKTRLQHKSNTSYDKLLKFKIKFKMIWIQNSNLFQLKSLLSSKECHWQPKLPAENFLFNHQSH